MHIYYAYENEMRDGAKKIIAILLIVLIVFGWYIMVFGLGKKVKPIKDKIQLGLDIKGGVYVVMEAKTNLKGEELRKLMIHDGIGIRWIRDPKVAHFLNVSGVSQPYG